MPMSKQLEHVHHQLCDVEKEAEKLSSGSFTEEQLRHLQNKLHHIDERYKEGCVTESHMKGDPYEEDGQAAVADELEKCHQKIYSMLNTLEK
ncbi:hypothetical protein BC943DRAFT_315129 [Umbelopsis sp. AD052]|nr:hypothetical protein BC943DRAFT_315129 [Umbelopsis sp. AD052]